MSTKKPKVTILPPGPEDANLRFQHYQWEPVFGSLANRSRLSPQAFKNFFRDVTLAREISSILSNARSSLLRCQDEADEQD